MVQIIQAQPTESDLKRRAFQEMLQGAVQSGAGLMGAIEQGRAGQRDARARAFDELSGIAQSGQEITPEMEQAAYKAAGYDPTKRYGLEAFGAAPEVEQDPRIAMLNQQAQQAQAQQAEAQEIRNLKKRGLEAGVQKTLYDISPEAREAERQEAMKEDVTKMRQQVMTSPATKDFQKVSAAVKKMESAVKNPSAAGDVALTFGVMKTFDPGSVVREGEFATAQNAGGIPERVRNIYNKIISGERLTPEQRADFYNTGISQATAQKQLFEESVAPYRQSVEQYQLPSEQIFPQFTLPEISPEQRALAQRQNVDTMSPPQSVPLGYSPLESSVQVPYAPTEQPNLGADAIANPQVILSPERTQQRQSRIQELRQKQGGQ